MTMFRRLAGRLCRLWPVAGPVRYPELWCRPATVLVLRDPRRAAAPLAGWR